MTPEEIAAAQAEVDRLAAEEKAAEDKAAADKAAADLAAKNAEVKFTQADLDRIAGTTRGEAKTAAQKELLSTLGVADLEAAAALVAKAKEIEDANKTELERATERAIAAEAARDEATANARAAVVLSRLDTELRNAGVNPDRIPAAMRLVDLTKLEVNGLDVVGIAQVIDGVKAQSPEWFVSRSASDASGGRVGDADYHGSSAADISKAAFERYGIRT